MKHIIKRLKSKTYWAAILGTAVVVLEQNAQFFGQYLPEQFRSMTILMWPVLMVALRELTTKPVGDK